MKFLILLLSFVINPSLSTDTVNEYAGTWTYSINTPDGNIQGSMILTYEDGEYSGKLSAYGQEYDMTDVEVVGNSLKFKTNAAGYSSSIAGKFEGNKYVATISVEGMEIPMTATRDN